MDRLPLIILAGSDPSSGEPPTAIQPPDSLQGYKGAHLLPWGRCLVAELIARVRKSNCFAEPILIGPRHVYGDKVNCEVIDVEGNLVVTLARTVETIRSHFGDRGPVAISSCDVLPSPGDFRRLIDDEYAPHHTCMFWGQLIQAQPEEMGASSWKPSYRIRPAAGEPIQTMYPGHLVILRPQSLRFDLTNRLLQLAYRYRNWPLNRRYFILTMRALSLLVAQDCRNLLAGQLPVLTLSLPLHSLLAYYKYRRQRMTVADFERNVAKTFLHRRFQHVENRPVVFSLTRIKSFAKDIDTKDELAEAGAGEPCDFE